jgi:Raf kinase inhibitor-like YbhB/YbcL family protein
MQTRSLTFSLLAPLSMAAALLMAAPGCSSDDPGPSGTGGKGGGGAGGGGGRGGSGGSGGSAAGSGGSTGGSSATGGSTGGSSATGGGGGTSAGTGGSSGGSGGSGGAGGGGSGGGSGDAARETGPVDGPGDVAAEAPTSNGPFALTSSVFKEGEVIERMYRCRTENISPPFTWTPGPSGTKSYAIMMHHMQAPHWMMWDIPADVTSLPAAIARAAMPPVPAGAKQAKPNVDGSTWYGYSGPCPGSPNRQYDFDVYALDVATLPNVTPDTAVRTVITAVRRNPLAHARLSGRASP